MNAKDLRKKLIDELGEFLIKEYSQVIRGKKSGFSSKSPSAREEVFEIFKQMILMESDIKRIKARTTESVLKLLQRGKIDLDEAERLMKIMHVKFEIEEIPKLMEKLSDIENK